MVEAKGLFGASAAVREATKAIHHPLLEKTNDVVDSRRPRTEFGKQR